AYRMALAARSRESRRQTVESCAANRHVASLLSEASWHELQGVLDEALQYVPLRYRTPLVLCYLQGKTQEESAQLLCCPLRTGRSRLARGRARLKQVLERRGLQLTATGLATALAAGDASAALPASLLNATAKAAVSFAVGAAPGTLVSGRVAALI